MKRIRVAALGLVTVLWSLSVMAANFTNQMPIEDLQAEIQAALANGETLQQVVQQAFAAGIDATTLYTAAVNVGVAPGAVVATAKQVGYSNEAVNDAVVQVALTAPPQGPSIPTSGLTGSTGLGSPSGGGGGSPN